MFNPVRDSTRMFFDVIRVRTLVKRTMHEFTYRKVRRSHTIPGYIFQAGYGESPVVGTALLRDPGWHVSTLFFAVSELRRTEK